MTESTHSQLSTFNSQNLHWFAVRVSYSRELTLKSILDKENIESFIPMCYGMVMKGGKRVSGRLCPPYIILSSFILRANVLMLLKDELEGTMPIRFIMNREHCRPVVIPDVPDAQFYLVASVVTMSQFFIWKQPNWIW